MWRPSRRANRLGAALVFVIATGCASYPTDERADWVLVGSNPASQSVTITAGFGGCSSYLRTDVHETSKAVRIDVTVRTTGADCKSILKTKTVELTLRDPLGTRNVAGECNGGEGTTCFALKPFLRVGGA